MTGFAHKGLRRSGQAAAAALAVSLAATPLLAGDAQKPAPVVLELFTSQGCISCPPADAVFARLADLPGVIALALHVDYWDYLGWTDAFADPSYTQRQQRYARAFGAKMIYTPQMILGGTSRLQGGREAEIREEISRLAQLPARVGLSVTRDGDQLQIDAGAEPPLTHPATLSIVRYIPSQDVDITRGENAGQKIVYRNVVESWSTVAEWGGQAPLSLSLPVSGDAPIVVLIQEQGPGPVLAARLLD